MKRQVCPLVILTAAVVGAVGSLLVAPPTKAAQDDVPRPVKSAWVGWKNGPPSAPGYFPIAVWLQSPRNASRYKRAGFNLYVGLWKGPTEEQLAALREAGMSVICAQNEVGLAHRDDPIIVGWMHGDEPDNAQARKDGRPGYDPPIPPAEIVKDYERIGKADPTRPVLLNLGQGVAWDKWRGRGVRTGKPEDYPQYILGGDIVSFDIYPVAHRHMEVRGNLWYVARGVERLCRWSLERKIVWNCLECTRISSDRKADPHQMRAEAWMAIIHGSRGLIWFVHEFKPKFQEAALLADPENLAAVTAINRQITELAPVINSPRIEGRLTVTSSNSEVPVATMLKVHAGAAYVFAAAMRDGSTKAEFTLPGRPLSATAHVLGEDRTIPVAGGRFQDAFGGYDVHIYRIERPRADQAQGKR